MNIFTDDAKGSAKERQELTRRAMAEAGGYEIGSGVGVKGSKSERARQQQQKTTQQLTALQTLMQDPAYADLHEQTMAMIDQKQTALDRAFVAHEKRMIELEDKAAKLPDGRPVFLRKDGTGQTKDGDVISQSIMATLNIPEDATTLDDYNVQLRHAATLSNMAEELDTIRTDINNKSEPPSLDELQAMLDRAQSIQPTSEPALPQKTQDSSTTADVTAAPVSDGLTPLAPPVR